MGPIRDLFRWNPTRRRSTARKTNIQKALDTKNSRLEGNDEEQDADKENADEVIQELERQRARAERYKKNFQNERKKVGRVVQKLQAVHQKLRDMTAARDTTEDLCQKTQFQLDKRESEVARLQHGKEALMRRNDNLRVRVSRSSRQKETAITRAIEKEQKKKTTFHIQEKGVVTETSRAMMRDLVALGVKATMVDAAVGCVAGHLGTAVEGKFTSRSTRRAVIEGGIASNLQIAEEMKSGGGK
jgi:chromosome segregation ATPase